MKTKHLVVAGVLAAVTALSCENSTTEPIVDSIEFGKGNGAPSGSHYNLNVIGVPHDKTADMTGNNGHRIFLDLEGKTRISLHKTDEFGVLDANGTDGKASFELPHPDPDGDGVTMYSVWVRALGKPGGGATTNTCATYEDPVTLEEQEYCSSQNLIMIRDKGKSVFNNADDYLLFMYVDLDGDGVEEKYPIFDETLQDFVWSYDNNGLKLLQMRFYMNS